MPFWPQSHFLQNGDKCYPASLVPKFTGAQTAWSEPHAGTCPSVCCPLGPGLQTEDAPRHTDAPTHSYLRPFNPGL